MKCPKCGSEVQESKFCSECGAPLSEETAAQEKAQENSKKKPKKKRGCGTVFLVFFAFILIGGFLTAIEDPQFSQSASAGRQAASMQSGSTAIPSAEKQAEIDAALAKLTKKADEVENSAYYMPSCYPEYANSRSFALPYIGEKDGNYGLLWKFNYTGSDWVFFSDVVINIDGEKAATIPFNYFDINQQVFTGGVYEAVDVNPASKYVDLLQKIASSEKTIIRFEGKDSKYDMTVSETDKQGIQDVLDAYNLVK